MSEPINSQQFCERIDTMQSELETLLERRLTHYLARVVKAIEGIDLREIANGYLQDIDYSLTGINEVDACALVDETISEIASETSTDDEE